MNRRRFLKGLLASGAGGALGGGALLNHTENTKLDEKAEQIRQQRPTHQLTQHEEELLAQHKRENVQTGMKGGAILGAAVYIGAKHRKGDERLAEESKLREMHEQIIEDDRERRREDEFRGGGRYRH